MHWLEIACSVIFFSGIVGSILAGCEEAETIRLRQQRLNELELETIRAFAELEQEG